MLEVRRSDEFSHGLFKEYPADGGETIQNDGDAEGNPAQELADSVVWVNHGLLLLQQQDDRGLLTVGGRLPPSHRLGVLSTT